MKYRSIITFLLLIFTNTLFAAEQTYDVVIPVDQIDTSAFENQLEGKLKQDISSYLGNSDFVVSVDADISKVQRMIKEKEMETTIESADDIVDYQLPGLLGGLTPSDLKKSVTKTKDRIQTTFRKINKIDVKLTLDSSVTQEQEDFIKSLVNHTANLDPIRGDTVQITKADFTKDSGSILSDGVADAGKSMLYYLVIGIIALILIVAAIVLCVFLLRKMKKKDKDDNLPVGASKDGIAPGGSPVPGSPLPSVIDDNSSADKLSPYLEYTKQDLVSLSLSNRPLAEEMIREAQLTPDGDKVLASLYLTLGGRLFNKLYPNIDSQSTKEFIKANPLEKSEIVNHFEHFTSKLAERKELEGSKYRPFHFLDNLDNSQILFLLQEETPKITALALSQLPSQRAAEIIQSIDKNRQAGVAFEMSQFENLPLESFKDIANKLAVKAQRVPSYNNIDIDGIQLLLNMLDNMSQAGINEFLAKLQSDSPDTYYKLRDVFFIFDDLMRIPNRILKTIVREFPRADIATALQDVTEEFSEHIFAALPSRLIGTIREEIDLNKGKIKQHKIDESKQNITNIVRHLIKHNRLAVADLVKLDKSDNKQNDNQDDNQDDKKDDLQQD